MLNRNNGTTSHNRNGVVSRRHVLGVVGAAGALAFQNSTWGQEVEVPQDPEQALKALGNDLYPLSVSFETYTALFRQLFEYFVERRLDEF